MLEHAMLWGIVETCKMKKALFFIFIISSILTISLISAAGQEICIDFTPPSAPSNLILTASGNNIQLSWDAATDTPSCSGIAYYEIFRNSVFLTNTNGSITNYLDNNLQYGTYSYTVYAVDLAGHNEGIGI